jgi:ABC-2 type transport system permease protein
MTTTLETVPVQVTAPSATHRMTTLVVHSRLLTARGLRALRRQPAYAAITLIQPIIWLLLFGELFKSVIHIPGFSSGGGTYLEFLTPGVIVMTALFASGWAGTTYIEDMNRGVMDRMLASPVSRGALMVGTLAYQTITTLVQCLVVFGVAYACGARYDAPGRGVAMTLVAVALFTVIFAALSNAIALLARQQEALIGISQFISLPLPFLSAALIDTSLAPSWLQEVARYNPVDWVVVVSREALSADPDWGAVLPRLGALAVVAVVMTFLATRAFRAYRRSA